MSQPHPQWVIEARQAVGDRIRVRRMELDWTQERLMDAAELSRNTLQRMEAGEEMKVSNLLRVADALRVHARDLLG
ncbi:helix-turn-helix domain-containing protein [Streptomyces sp. NBC_01324]|uniref:helix-turn-helix domain-containing protein n=1 Tax=Streptomyces sp. NBC_01324 TaxID=2903826 RepID=UPI002E1601C2|nr:helix-turn-helix domain-containing protein [Streptomyces sp. NBC_01324]